MVTICIISAIVGAILEYLFIKNSRILVNRPRYQYFNHVDFYVGNRREPKSKLKDGSKEDLARLVNELEYDFNSSSYNVSASNRLGSLLDNVHTNQYKLSQDELSSIIKKLDSYLGLKKQDILDLLEIEAILKEKNCIKPQYFNINSPWKGVALTFIISILLLGLYTAYRMFWPVGSEQVLLEDFISDSHHCRIVVVHRERCKYYRGGFQEKESFQKYVKGKNYMYCNCVDFSEMELLDAYSKKNRWNVSDDII